MGRVMGLLYKGCEGEIPHFPLVFLSLLFPNEKMLSPLSVLSHLPYEFAGEGGVVGGVWRGG